MNEAILVFSFMSNFTSGVGVVFVNGLIKQLTCGAPFKRGSLSELELCIFNSSSHLSLVRARFKELLDEAFLFNFVWHKTAPNNL